MKNKIFFLLTFVLAQSAFAASTLCLKADGTDTSVATIKIDWQNSSLNPTALVTLTGQNGNQLKFKTSFQSGSMNTTCGFYAWKEAFLQPSTPGSGQFKVRLMTGGCASRDDNGNIIKYSALLDVKTWDGLGRDAFTCNQF